MIFIPLSKRLRHSGAVGRTTIAMILVGVTVWGLFCLTPSTPRVTTVETPLLSNVQAPPTVRTQRNAPDFVVWGEDGRTIRLSDFKGQVVILDFWATWCAPCLRSFPQTASTARLYRNNGVVVLAVNVWDSQQAFARWTSHHPEYKPIVFATDPTSDGHDVARFLYHVSGIPTRIIIDRSGMIVARMTGFNVSDDGLRTAVAKAQDRALR